MQPPAFVNMQFFSLTLTLESRKEPAWSGDQVLPGLEWQLSVPRWLH